MSSVSDERKGHVDWPSALAGLIQAGALASRNPMPDTDWTKALSQETAQSYFEALANAGAIASGNRKLFPDPEGS